MTKLFIFLFLRSFVLLHNSLCLFVYCYLFSLYLATFYKHIIISKVQKTYKKVAPQEKNKRAGCRFSFIFLSFLAFRADLPAQLVYLHFISLPNRLMCCVWWTDLDVGDLLGELLRYDTTRPTFDIRHIPWW